MLVGGNCKEKILARKNMMTNAEGKLADYILENYDETLNLTVSELAEKAGVSDASVVRFCKGMGYKGYQDFKVNAAKDVLPNVSYLNPSLEQGDDAETICNKIFNSGITVLNRTLANMDFGVMQQAADEIRAAERVVFFGSGGSLLIGKTAQHRFMKFGIPVFVYDDMELQQMASSLMQAGDLAVGISHSGSNRNVINCMKRARENGAKTIALVSQGKTPLAKTADLVLYSASESTIFSSESISSRIAQLAIIDSLVSLVALSEYENSLAAIQKTRKATSEGNL